MRSIDGHGQSFHSSPSIPCHRLCLQEIKLKSLQNEFHPFAHVFWNFRGKALLILVIATFLYYYIFLLTKFEWWSEIMNFFWTLIELFQRGMRIWYHQWATSWKKHPRTIRKNRRQAPSPPRHFHSCPSSTKAPRSGTWNTVVQYTWYCNLSEQTYMHFTTFSKDSAMFFKPKWSLLDSLLDCMSIFSYWCTWLFFVGSYLNYSYWLLNKYYSIMQDCKL